MHGSSIVVYVDYGNIHFDIKRIMKKKNISKTQLAKLTGLHHQIIDRYYNDNVTRFDKDILAKLCFVLNCELEDIIHYEKPSK